MILSFFILVVSAQDLIDVSSLKPDVEEKWSEEWSAVYQVPIFNEYQRSLNNRIVALELYVNTAIIEASYYIGTSDSLISSGCGLANAYSLFVTLQFKEKMPVFNEGSKYLVKGRLKLNATEILENFYILEDAEIVE